MICTDARIDCKLVFRRWRGYLAIDNVEGDKQGVARGGSDVALYVIPRSHGRYFRLAACSQPLGGPPIAAYTHNYKRRADIFGGNHDEMG